VFSFFLAFLLSTNRRAINPRTVLGALAIQVVFGVVVLYWDVGKRILRAVSGGVQAIINSSREGISFLFGPVLP
jgi:CNT family concentrative nucleoside transporter